jgi:hypothetical protein
MRDLGLDVLSVAILAAALSGALTSTAEAYIDPGAGNLLLQALLGGAAGLAVLLRIVAQRVRRRIRIRPRPGVPADPSHP